jgi:hypothetical protein
MNSNEKMVGTLHELGNASGRELIRFTPRHVLVELNQPLPPAEAALSVLRSLNRLRVISKKPREASLTG